MSGQFQPGIIHFLRLHLLMLSVSHPAQVLFNPFQPIPAYNLYVFVVLCCRSVYTVYLWLLVHASLNLVKVSIH